MTEAETAATILTRFETAWAALDTTVKGLSERELTAIRDPAGWSAKDHLSHLAAWDQALLATLDGRPRHEVLGIDETLAASEDYDAMNAAIFTATRRHLSALATGAPPAEQFLTDAPGYADHYDQHHAWIRELVKR